MKSQGKESGESIAKEIAQKYNISEKEINEILYRHGVHKAFKIKKYIISLITSLEINYKTILNENIKIKTELNLLHKNYKDKDNRILNCAQKLEHIRGKKQMFEKIIQLLKRIKIIESKHDKNYKEIEI